MNAMLRHKLTLLGQLVKGSQLHETTQFSITTVSREPTTYMKETGNFVATNAILQ